MTHPEPGEVVQVDPDKCRWGPVFLIVEEVKTWGVIGYFYTHPMPPLEGATCAPAYLRVNHGDYERIGVSVWREMSRRVNE